MVYFTIVNKTRCHCILAGRTVVQLRKPQKKKKKKKKKKKSKQTQEYIHGDHLQKTLKGINLIKNRGMRGCCLLWLIIWHHVWE